MKLLKHLINFVTVAAVAASVSACVGDNTTSTKTQQVMSVNNSQTNSNIITKADLKIIFYDMNNGHGYSGNLGGVSGADNLCQIAAQNQEWHPNLPQQAKWKALIAAKGVREPSSMDKIALDWVLQPGVTYMNESLEIFGPATEFGILEYPSPVSIYRGNSISSEINNEAWTGIHVAYKTKETPYYKKYPEGILNQDKWSASEHNCDSWTSNKEFEVTGKFEPYNAFGGSGRMSQYIDNSFNTLFSGSEINSLPTKCTSSIGLLCVQQ
ncbi:MAG: DUF1554 domain-containing protein [Burkholderiales bacterium]|nr:DUF1554 domain-containing protein [Burkholderiales bacterium]